MAHPSDRSDPINQGAGRDPDYPPRRGGYSLISSYHCSRYNTNTGRLTTTMFEDVFHIALTHRLSETS